jgi:ubiquitin C-terminal hydrolase
MPGNRLICKQCGGFEFKQVKVDSWKCLNCGKIKRTTKTMTITKRRNEIPKESITTSKQYKVLVAYCENCGEKIDRLGHPSDQKRMNNKWANHICIIEKKTDNFYN